MNDMKSTASGNNTTYDPDRAESIQTYVSDMLALERHIAGPLERQRDADESKNDARAIALFTQIKSRTDAHVAALEARLRNLGGNPSNPVKSAWSGLLGVGAAAVDGVRKTKISKNLRDDYTALSLATVSYSMLNATALGLGDTDTANLAQRHLADYARLIMDIGKAIPGVVLRELADGGQKVDVTVAAQAERTVEQSWRNEGERAGLN
jgi:ferritin-like metal-binding protein YciE